MPAAGSSGAGCGKTFGKGMAAHADTTSGASAAARIRCITDHSSQRISWTANMVRGRWPAIRGSGARWTKVRGSGAGSKTGRRQQENCFGARCERWREIDRQAQHQATGGTAIDAIGAAVAVRGAIGLRIASRGHRIFAVMGSMLVMMRCGCMAMRGNNGQCVRPIGRCGIGAGHEIHGRERQHQHKPWPERWLHPGREAQKAHER